MLQKSDLEDNIAEYIAERLPHAEIKILFDVGANVGWFTSQFLKAYPNCECYLFEPVTANYEAIPSTLNNYPETNPFPRTKCFRVALGLVPEHSRVTAIPGVTVNRVIGTNPTLEPVEEVEIITGDAFCAEHRIDRISFLKIDTEGYDLKVLLGFAGMLTEQKVDFVQVEAGIAPGNALHVSIAAIEALLNSFGYRLFRYTNQASLSVPILTWADVVFINERTAHTLAATTHLINRTAALSADRDGLSWSGFKDQVAAARRAMDARDWQQAAALWSSVVHDFPDQVAGFLGKGDALRKMGRLDEAEAVLAQAMSEFPLELWVAAGHASIAAQRRDFGEALQRWEEVKKRFPDHPIGYSGQGEALRDAGRLDEAEQIFASGLRLFPADPWLATHYAGVASSRGDWASALHRWDDLKSHFPEHSPAYVGLADALRESGRINDADKLLADAIERFPKDEWIAITWARIAMHRRDWDDALRRWDIVLARFPRNAIAHTEKAEAQAAASHYNIIGKQTRPRLERRKHSAGDTKFSAYLSVYNDWDILESTLQSIKPFVDELVVVDGGYKWMGPFLYETGRNPEKSDERVYNAIEAAGIPFRVISQVWESELEKRRAGYLACKHRFIFRVDADEIIYFDDNLEAFLDAGGAVAGMEMPLYIAPGWIRGRKTDRTIERQCFMFDSKQISADAHLTYLWLVLSVGDQLPNAGDRPVVFPAPVAFNAHLSVWRTPTTSVNRAAFYVLNEVRKHGAPWIPDLRSNPLSDLRELFKHIPPKAFLEILLNSDIVLGYPFLDDDFILKDSPLSKTDEAKFSKIYTEFLNGLAQSNENLATSGRYLLDEFKIDLSSAEAVRPLLGNSGLAFLFSSDLNGAQVWLDYLLPFEPWVLRKPIKFEIEENRLIVDTLPETPSNSGYLRRILVISPSFMDSNPLHRVVCV